MDALHELYDLEYNIKAPNKMKLLTVVRLQGFPTAVKPEILQNIKTACYPNHTFRHHNMKSNFNNESNTLLTRNQ